MPLSATFSTSAHWDLQGRTHLPKEASGGSLLWPLSLRPAKSHVIEPAVSFRPEVSWQQANGGGSRGTSGFPGRLVEKILIRRQFRQFRPADFIGLHKRHDAPRMSSAMYALSKRATPGAVHVLYSPALLLSESVAANPRWAGQQHAGTTHAADQSSICVRQAAHSVRVLTQDVSGCWRTLSARGCGGQPQSRKCRPARALACLVASGKFLQRKEQRRRRFDGDYLPTYDSVRYSTRTLQPDSWCRVS